MKHVVDPLSIAVCISFGIFYLASVSCIELNQNDAALIVDAGSLGKIKGIQLWTLGPTNTTRRRYISFNGIKYAEPPTGNNRFRPSKLATGNLTPDGQPYFSATLPGLSCSQPDVVVPIPQSEDCLSLNVHTPRLPGNDSSLLPVIVFIHGGAFTAGTGGTYNGGRLLNKDVVLVAINYRLGAFGFYTLDNEDIPGNAGLSDMITALKWVNQFITYFGGDPGRVTISGQSSGSVAVTHLLASPSAKGLFHGAIGTSGSALAKWGTTTADKAMVSSLRMAEIASCYNSSIGPPDEAYLKEIARCMRNDVNTTALVNALYVYQVEERLLGKLGFDAVSAVVQTFDASEEFDRIVPEHPEEVFKSGRQTNVPLMMGTNRHDGSYVLGVLYQRYLKPNDYVNDKEFMSKQVVPKILEALGMETDLGIQNTLAKAYLGDSRKTGLFSEMYPGFIDLFSVFFFKAPAYQTALYHSELNNDTYWYSFDYEGFYTMFGILFMEDRPPIRSGIGHGDDLIYVFQTSLPLNDGDRAVSYKMVEYWTNFAIYGNPNGISDSNSSWPPLNDTDQTYCSIQAEPVVLTHFEDYWNDVGWEVLPTIPTRKPTVATTPVTGETSTAGADSMSYSFYLSLIAVLIVSFTSSSHKQC